jgi:hypothetical protein
MALDTRLVCRFEVEEVLVFSPVRPVAAQALQCDVGIPGIDNLLANRVCRMRLPFVTFRAELDRRGFLRQKGVVGAVGRVTLVARPFRDRRVLGL